MAYDLEEQEQIDTAKAWWSKYGNTILTIVTVLALAFAGFRAYQWYQADQAAKAATLYEAVKTGIVAKDAAKVKEASAQMFSKFASTAYAQMTALQIAKFYFDQKDLVNAKTMLQFAVDKAQDEEFRHTARLRLAGLLLDEKSYDAGLALLGVTPPAAYVALYADRRGDLLAASNKPAEAKTAYKTAIDTLEDSSPLKETVRLKYNALGGDAS
jgi:predicted negative regulator of RcsB-dependent stress response